MNQRMRAKLLNWEKGWNLRECSSAVLSVPRWLMSEVRRSSSWHQKLRGWQNVRPRQRPGSTWAVTEASNMVRMELRNPFGSEISAAQSCCWPSWLLTFGIVLLAEDQKAIRCKNVSKQGLTKAFRQRLQETSFVGKRPHATGSANSLLNFSNFARGRHCTRTIYIHSFTQNRYSTTHKAHSPTEHIKFDWVICRRQNEEHIWILKPLFSRRNHLEFNCISIALADFLFFFFPR